MFASYAVQVYFSLLSQGEPCSHILHFFRAKAPRAFEQGLATASEEAREAAWDWMAENYGEQLGEGD